MKQQTLAMAADQSAQYEQYRKPTKRDVFLATMEQIVPRREPAGPKRLDELLERARVNRCQEHPGASVRLGADGAGANGQGTSPAADPVEEHGWRHPDAVRQAGPCGADRSRGEGLLDGTDDRAPRGAATKRRGVIELNEERHVCRHEGSGRRKPRLDLAPRPDALPRRAAFRGAPAGVPISGW